MPNTSSEDKNFCGVCTDGALARTKSEDKLNDNLKEETTGNLEPLEM